MAPKGWLQWWHGAIAPFVRYQNQLSTTVVPVEAPLIEQGELIPAYISSLDVNSGAWMLATTDHGGPLRVFAGETRGVRSTPESRFHGINFPKRFWSGCLDCNNALRPQRLRVINFFCSRGDAETRRRVEEVMIVFLQST
jgi:hypothetical protein